MAAKPCNLCKSAAALLFCLPDSSFLCISCDSKIHNLTSMHEKVYMCDVCEHAPATVNCKADAASLCWTCDNDVHSANSLSSRHERTPVVPFYHTADNNMKIGNNCSDSWICSDSILDLKLSEFLNSASDELVEFDYRISDDQLNSGSDNVVPDQNINPFHRFFDNSSENRFEIDFSRARINSFNNNKNDFIHPSLSDSVSSSSSMEVGVVPDGASISEATYSYGRSMSSNIDLCGSVGGANQGSQLPELDRKARVLRYREKRKARRFEKTVRYASRKVYAETRPRIKGRFARRTEVDDCGDDQCDARYGIVQLLS